MTHYTREPKRWLCGLLCGLVMLLTAVGIAHFGYEAHLNQSSTAAAVAVLILLLGLAISLPLFNVADSDTERELAEVKT